MRLMCAARVSALGGCIRTWARNHTRQYVYVFACSRRYCYGYGLARAYFYGYSYGGEVG